MPNCDTYTVRGLCILPEHPNFRQPWIEACHLPQDVPSSAKICWKHFKNSDFKSEIVFENIKTCRFPCLKRGVVPSLLLPSSETENILSENDLPESKLPDNELPVIDLPENTLTNCDIVIKSATKSDPITVIVEYQKVKYI